MTSTIRVVGERKKIVPKCGWMHMSNKGDGGPGYKHVDALNIFFFKVFSMNIIRICAFPFWRVFFLIRNNYEFKSFVSPHQGSISAL